VDQHAKRLGQRSFQSNKVNAYPEGIETRTRLNGLFSSPSHDPFGKSSEYSSYK